MYRYLVAKRGSVASWILDSTVPFFNNISSGLVATKKTGTSDPTKSVSLVAGSDYSSVFKNASIGKFECPYYRQGDESKSFALEAWILPIPKTTTGAQAIFSHDGQTDGLSINGKVIRFATAYTTAADAEVTFDLQVYKLAHVVAVHTGDKNELWVNNKMVSSINLTDAQKADTYEFTDDGYLYSGFSGSNQEIAMNGVAFYQNIDAFTISQNYAAGLNAVPQASIAPQWKGAGLSCGGIKTNLFYERTWATESDFRQGYNAGCTITPVALVPSYDAISGLSSASSWICSIPLDIGSDATIYGVALDWSGTGITVDSSLDGVTWTAATAGSLVSTITNGYVPTNKDLWVRVSFAGGQAVDPSYLESITVSGYRAIEFLNSLNRTVGTTHPAVLRGDFEPNLFRDDNGVSLKGQTLTIGTDTSADPTIARTLEAWIKVVSGTPTINIGGTKYRNGAADSTLPIGEWSLIHYVAAADIATTITIAGDVIVGQVVLYPTALSATDVLNAYKSYTGYPAKRFSDSSAITVSQPGDPLEMYSHSWQIVAGG